MILEQRLDTERLATAATWLLAIVCVGLLLRAGILVIDGVEVDFQPIALEPQQAAPVASGPVDWRMFGEPGEADYGFDRPLPPTPLSLRLRGVVTGARGYAIIVDARGNEGVYRVADEVPGEAVVVAIEPRRVVMRREGRREALELAGGQPPAAPSQMRQSEMNDAGPASGLGIGSLAGMASQYTLDPAELARRITILPVAGGGFRVRGGADAALFTQLGFRANDIVLAINGRRVDNQADVRAVFESFRPGEPLAITVRRDDQRLVLTPDTSNFSGAQP